MCAGVQFNERRLCIDKKKRKTQRGISRNEIFRVMIKLELEKGGAEGRRKKRVQILISCMWEKVPKVEGKEVMTG